MYNQTLRKMHRKCRQRKKRMTPHNTCTTGDGYLQQNTDCYAWRYEVAVTYVQLAVDKRKKKPQRGFKKHELRKKEMKLRAWELTKSRSLSTPAVAAAAAAATTAEELGIAVVIGQVHS